MAAPVRMLDVWIVELNKVYTGVPYTIVTDWLEQGRLLGVDRVRMAGKSKWHLIGTVPALAPYLPKPTPLAAEDKAEALEAVDLGMQSVRVREEEDDDVDMIPLIDVSLVLLIFFMMTTAISSGVFSNIPTPVAKHQLASISSDMYWIGIEKKPDPETGKPAVLFALGKDSLKSKYLVEPTPDGAAMLAQLAEELDGQEGEMRVRLRAEKTLPIETIKGLTLDLQELESRINRQRPADKKLQLSILGEVSEPSK